MALLFLVLVWLAMLQLHLIPTGKPSSGTDFRTLGLGFKRGGTGGWFPSGAQASFSICLIRGSLAPLHTMTLPCSQARTCKEKKKKKLKLCTFNVHRTWGATKLPPQTPRQLTTCCAVFSSEFVFSVTTDRVGITVRSVLQGQFYVLFNFSSMNK